MEPSQSELKLARSDLQCSPLLDRWYCNKSDFSSLQRIRYLRARPTNSGPPVLPTMFPDWRDAGNRRGQLTVERDLSWYSMFILVMTTCMSKTHGEWLSPALVSQFPLPANSDERKRSWIFFGSFVLQLSTSPSPVHPSGHRFIHRPRTDAMRQASICFIMVNALTSVPCEDHSVYHA